MSTQKELNILRTRSKKTDRVWSDRCVPNSNLFADPKKSSKELNRSVRKSLYQATDNGMQHCLTTCQQPCLTSGCDRCLPRRLERKSHFIQAKEWRLAVQGRRTMVNYINIDIAKQGQYPPCRKSCDFLARAFAIAGSGGYGRCWQRLLGKDRQMTPIESRVDQRPAHTPGRSLH
jgi:hypothetical protein